MKLPTHLILFGLTFAGLPVHAATLTSGEIDLIGVVYDGINFEPESHVVDGIVDNVNIVDQEYPAGDVTVQVSATTTRDAGLAWNPIGVGAGQTYFITRQANISGEPYVGVGLEELNPLDWTGNITIELTGAVVPTGGFFSLWKDGVTPNFFMSTFDGINAADSVSIVPGGHEHYNWGFTEEGTYELTFLISGDHAVDGAKSTTATYSFSVIPEPSSALLGAFSALALLRRRRN